ncbi:MAG: restriction endonuclease [Gammaproteobacteria bacterium]|nr:restriction endonuclease [Gammaproteobacteria bacterium]
MTKKDNFPTHIDLMWPTLQAVKMLGGSGSIEEIFDKVVEIQQYPESIQNIPAASGNNTQLEYRAGWARSYLKKAGALENSSRGVWAITKFGETIQESDVKGLNKKVRDSYPENKEVVFSKPNQISEQEVISWKDELLSELQQIEPSDFEKLCQRLLRESGFIKVEVTGKSHDGGIDGVGVLRVNLLSFQVIFQCKRYKGSVGSSAVRDFRGAMVGRSDKGLIITTGSFTSEARKEATRDGAPTIDLIDGSELCEFMKNLKMGVEVNTIEVVKVDKNWFEKL